MPDLLYNTIVTLYMYMKNYAHFSKLGGAFMEKNLTHISLVSLFWDLCKQCRPRSDAASDQGLHSLLKVFSIKNKLKMVKYSRHS